MQQDERVALRVIDKAIAQRCESIASERAWWPCEQGCADCCRRLADLPEMTRPEWTRVEEAFLELDPSVRGEVVKGIEAMLQAKARGEAFVTCAFLDDPAGACRIYEARPAACRTYGFFVAGPRELWCSKIDEALEAQEEGGAGALMWGNHRGVEGKLAARFGPRVTMEQWWRDVGRKGGHRSGE